MRTLKIFLIGIILGISLVLNVVEAATKKIFLLDSYDATYAWNMSEQEGVQTAFKDQKDIEIKVHFMDTKRNPSPEFKQEAGKKALDAIKAYQPDLIIALDDNASEYVIQQIKDIPVVVCGINEDPKKYQYGENVAVILERHPFDQVIKLLKDLVPTAKTLAVITDDTKETSGAAVERLKGLAPKIKESTGIDIVAYHEIGSFQEFQTLVQSYQPGQPQAVSGLLIYNLHTFKDENGKVVPVKQVVKWFIEHNQLPDLNVFDWGPQYGMLAAVTVSGRVQGLEAGKYALRILGGEKPNTLPILDPKTGDILLNLAKAKKLGIEIPIELLSVAKTFESMEALDPNFLATK
ncbi:MAG TPA: ABC transporter substrate binding protein [Candidatus Limnocylindrales bacterium]|nr:ABC transporter substrate binding protein [Candidatus Limnocylindrales bacterium]